MSDEQNIKRDDPMIAAEFSLGLLEGEELLAARGKLSTDEAFAERKEWWDNWFVPLSDNVGGAEPSADVWSRIEAQVSAGNGSTVVAAPLGQHAPDRTVIDLQSRVRRWQWTAGITSAAAAVALALFVFAPGTGPAPTPAPETQIAAADPLMATVPIGDTGLRLDVTYDPKSERMLIGAIGLTADGVHDHELWLVPQEGELQSLGVVKPGDVISMELPDEIARNVLDGSEVLLTREPIGGKPEGVDAGPVVAEGAFKTV